MNNVLETGTQQTNSLVVDLVSDLICPWCFVAKRRVEKTAAILGKKVEIHWLPFELNADMPVDGLDRRMYRSAKFGSWEESQRLDARVAAAGAEVGIAFRHEADTKHSSRSRSTCSSSQTRLRDSRPDCGTIISSKPSLYALLPR